jgi:hypothetical protein
MTCEGLSSHARRIAKIVGHHDLLRRCVAGRDRTSNEHFAVDSLQITANAANAIVDDRKVMQLECGRGAQL